MDTHFPKTLFVSDIDETCLQCSGEAPDLAVQENTIEVAIYEFRCVKMLKNESRLMGERDEE